MSASGNMSNVLLVSTAMLLSSFSASIADEPISLNVDERPPFHFQKDDGSPDGAAYVVVKCAFDKIGRSVQVNFMPWKRAQEEVKAGNANGFFSASRNKSRDEYATASDTIADQYWSWYLKADSTLDPDVDSFKSSAGVGSWFGSNSLKWLETNGYQVKSQAKTADQLLKQLESGKIDAVFGSNYVFDDAIKNMGMSSAFKEVKGLHKPMGIYFSNNFLSGESGFLNELNKAIGECS